MRVLVIGGTGFIGSYVVSKLNQTVDEVYVLHRGRTDREFPAGVKSVICDRSKQKELSRTMTEVAPDVVIDMIPRTAQETWSVLQSVPQNLKRLVIISSIDVYRAYNRLRKIELGEPDATPIKEDGPLREILFPYRGNAVDALHTSYMYEKLLVEGLTRSEMKIPSTILRLPVVFGPNDPQSRTFVYVSRMNDKRPTLLLGKKQSNWKVTRGYVEDVADVIAACALKDDGESHVFNVGEREPVNERQWVEELARTMNWDGEILEIDDSQLPSHLIEDFDWNQDLTIDCSSVKEYLGSAKVTEMEEALAKTVRWQIDNSPLEKKNDPAEYGAEDKLINSVRRLANPSRA